MSFSEIDLLKKIFKYFEFLYIYIGKFILIFSSKYIQKNNIMFMNQKIINERKIK
jgi:hypothetical protein